MEKEQIIDYVMYTPHNTNPAILRQMIDDVGGGGSSQDFVVGIEAEFTEDGKVVITQVDRTFDQIIDAIENNFNVRAHMRLYTDGVTSEASLQYSGHQLMDDGGQLTFSCVTVGPIGNNTMIVAVSVICVSIPDEGERWMYIMYNATQ